MPQAKTLITPEEVMREAYPGKLESLRRKELHKLFDIHGIEYGGHLVKDDLVKLAHGIEAMGYDLWTRPEHQKKPELPWPRAASTPADNIESTAKGRTTSETFNPPPVEAVPMQQPAADDGNAQAIDADEWAELQELSTKDLRKAVKAMGLKQALGASRRDLTVNLMAHAPRTDIQKWITENVQNEDAA